MFKTHSNIARLWMLCAATLLISSTFACQKLIEDAGLSDLFEDQVDQQSSDGSATEDSNILQGDDPLGMVAEHNTARANASPTPSPALPEMTWDSALAETAQAWADRCVFEHSSNQYGENLYASTNQSDAATAVNAWVREVEDYDYESNQCSGVCGHYTQVVWRDSTRLGCAYADCDWLNGLESSGRFWVCNYDPPGNYIGQKPY